jgi:hypothetical protein
MNFTKITGPRLSTVQRRLGVAAVAVAALAAVAPGSALAGNQKTAGRSVTEQLQFMSTSSSSSNLTAIVTGRFAAGGIASGDFAQGGTELVKVDGGTFKVTPVTISGFGGDSSATCLSVIAAKGTYKIRGGTGKYTGVHGSGAFRIKIVSVSVRSKDGGCGRTIVTQSTFTLSGPVRM